MSRIYVQLKHFAFCLPFQPKDDGGQFECWTVGIWVRPVQNSCTYNIMLPTWEWKRYPAKIIYRLNICLLKKRELARQLFFTTWYYYIVLHVQNKKIVFHSLQCAQPITAFLMPGLVDKIHNTIQSKKPKMVSHHYNYYTLILWLKKEGLFFILFGPNWYNQISESKYFRF